MSENSPFSPKPLPSLGYGDYLRYSQLMQERFGLAFPEKRRMELEIGVRRAFAASTCPDLNAYYELLCDPVRGAPELERLVNALTVGETYFFRDAGQFNALITHVLPEIIARRRMVRTLRIWSAGCASGEEPYSIAMALVDLLPDLKDWTITILATDINSQNLERARQGVYSEWAFREERARQLRGRFFTQQGNLYHLDPAIRRMVSFAQLNLASSQYPSFDNNTMYMDLILCRNVTIYFPESVTRAVIDRFYNALSDYGWLVVGHSEHSLDTYQKFQARSFPEAILYQRAPTPIPAAAPAPARPALDNPPLTLAPLPDPAPAAAHPDNEPHSGQSNDFEQAQAMFGFGKLEEASELLHRWLKAHPRHAPGCALLAKICADLGNLSEAEPWCRRAIQADRLNLDAYYTLALIYQHLGDSEKALENMKTVVYIDRNDILGHYSLANLYHDRLQFPQALKSLDNARRLLENRRDDEVIPRSDGITAGRLKQAVIQQQQQWTAAVSGEAEKHPQP
mgnify:CR=1 FL=1